MTQYYFYFPVSQDTWNDVMQVSQNKGMDLNATARSFLEHGMNKSKEPELPEAPLYEPQFCKACEE